MDIVIIAHFITEFAKDGTSRFVYMAEELSKTHNVEILTSQFDHIKKKQRKEQEYTLKTKITLLKEPSYPKNVCFKRFYSHGIFGNQVKKYLKSRKKPDVVYCAVPSLSVAVAAAKYCKENGIKFVIDIQDIWPEAFKMVFNVPVISDIVFFPMKKQADYIYSSADEIVGVSQTYVNRGLQVNNKAKGMVVYLGTDKDTFDKNKNNDENALPIAEHKIKIGYAGTLGHSYDLHVVFDAMKKLDKEILQKIQLIVMGDGPKKEEFQQAAKDLPVTFMGRLNYPNMVWLLSKCDIAVNPIMPGAAQSIINKHMDYAMAGLPVINTQECPEYRSLVSSYNCGINCECGNSEDVAEAILKLINNEELRRELGKNSRSMGEKLFDRKTSYLDIVDVIQQKG